MRKNFMMMALVSVAMMTSCSGNKTAQGVAEEDSTVVAECAADSEGVDLTAVAGTYEGTLPAADCPGIKTVLTINADSTYQLQQDYIDREAGHDEASGVLEVLDGNVLMLVRPSSGEHTFYKVKDAESIAMTDSLGNEAEGEIAKLYVLTKKK